MEGVEEEEGFVEVVGLGPEVVKLRLRGSWVVEVEEEAVGAVGIPDEEEDLEGAGVRLVS